MNILVTLHPGYGIGDAVQMSAVLRHLHKHRPDWEIDYGAEEGKHQVGRGVVRSTFTLKTPLPSERYDAVIQICLYDTWANWEDRPNTRVSAALHECFDLPWDSECGRYMVQVSDTAVGMVRQSSAIYLSGGNAGRRSNCVALHYRGDSSQDRKNLTPAQATDVCDEVRRLGHTPLVLDYRNESLVLAPKVTNPEWGRSAEMQCAVISQCAAFVGIDSGPAKCAAATDTPSLVVWTGHNPAAFFDPAPNVTHLVPARYRGLYPECPAPVLRWFEEHSSVRFYGNDPVVSVKEWLREVLR